MLERELIEAIRQLDHHDLRRLLILAQARLESSGGAPQASASKVSFRQKWVRCGKASCGSCPHGPYWYAYWREEGRRRSRYVGRLQDVEMPGVEGAHQ